MFLKTQTNLDMSSLTWVALLSLLVEVFVSSIGIIPVPNFYAPEILDQKVNNKIIERQRSVRIASRIILTINFLLL